MKLDLALLGLAASLSGFANAADDKVANKIEYNDVGFKGYFGAVTSLKHIWQSKKCKCEVGKKRWFEGVNSPLDGYTSVQVRGPVELKQFAVYTAEYFSSGDESGNSTAWLRKGYYNAVEQQQNNVTFLNNYGAVSPCLGGALAYAGPDGVSTSEEPHILAPDNNLPSGKEYSIYSNHLCPHSGDGNGCGVYRHGIPAYYGFYGHTKMFLFEFTMPEDQRQNMSAIPYYDLPSISIFSDRIARQSINPRNPACSCKASGCGVYDVFQALSGDQKDRLFSTLHTTQTGGQTIQDLTSDGYMKRTNGVMRGGVIFDSTGRITTFLNNNTLFDVSLNSTDVNTWLSEIAADLTVSTTVETASNSTTTTSSN